MIYNLTMHNQKVAAEILGLDIEHAPRLKPVGDVSDYDQLKSIVKEAVRGIPQGAKCVIGGLGQYQALIMQMPFRFYFLSMENRVPNGLIEHQPFTRQEIFEIEYQPLVRQEIFNA